MELKKVRRTLKGFYRDVDRHIYHDIVKFPFDTFSVLSPFELAEAVYFLQEGVRGGFECQNIFAGEKGCNLHAQITLQEFWVTMTNAGFTDREDPMDVWHKPWDADSEKMGAIYPFNPFNHYYLDRTRNILPKRADKSLSINEYSAYSMFYDVGPLEWATFNQELPFDAKIDGIIEPMAGTASFSFFAQFFDPTLRVVMIDLDESARAWTNDWLTFVGPHRYIVGDATSHPHWYGAKHFLKDSKCILGYLGRQSHHILNISDMLDLVKCLCTNCDIIYIDGGNIVVDTDDIANETENDIEHPVLDSFKLKIETTLNKEPQFNLLERIFNYKVEIVSKVNKKNRIALGTVGGDTWTDYSESTIVQMFRAVAPNAEIYFMGDGDEDKYEPISKCVGLKFDDDKSYSFIIDNRKRQKND